MTKRLPGRPRWVTDGKWFRFESPLEDEYGLTLENVYLGGSAGVDFLDRRVVLNLRAGPPVLPSMLAVNRLCWRASRHTNLVGPLEHRGTIPTDSTHFHPLEHNWLAEQQQLLPQNLPYAHRVEDEPADFRSMLALAERLLRIDGLQDGISEPPWQRTLFNVRDGTQ